MPVQLTKMHWRRIRALSLTSGLALLALGCGGPSPDLDAPSPSPAACSAGENGVGAEEGQLLPAISVATCDNEETNLREIACGAKLTLLDVGAAAFRQCVTATDTYATDPDFTDLKVQGLNIVQVFTADASLSPATPAFCRQYRTNHAVDFTFLIDPLGNTDGLAAVHPLNLVLDQNGKVLHKWVGEIPTDRVDILRALLADTAE